MTGQGACFVKVPMWPDRAACFTGQSPLTHVHNRVRSGRTPSKSPRKFGLGEVCGLFFFENASSFFLTVGLVSSLQIRNRHSTLKFSLQVSVQIETHIRRFDIFPPRRISGSVFAESSWSSSTTKANNRNSWSFYRFVPPPKKWHWHQDDLLRQRNLFDVILVCKWSRVWLHPFSTRNECFFLPVYVSQVTSVWLVLDSIHVFF